MSKFFDKDDLKRNVELNEYSLSIFNNDELLKEKLALYIQRPKSEASYFEAAKKFFAAGEHKSLKYEPTWSWWAFFMGALFFYYRKLNSQGHVALGAQIANEVLSYKNQSLGALGELSIGAVAARHAKFYVIARFARLLNEQNDELLKNEGGIPKNFWSMMLMGLAMIVVVSFIIIMFFDIE